LLNFWFFATIFLALADWSALWLKRPQINIISKPTTLIALILWFTSQGGWDQAPVWFGLALVFSLFGDIFLLLPDRFFIFGLGAFLCAHISYIIGFSPKSPAGNPPFLILGVLILSVGGLLCSIIRKAIDNNSTYAKLKTPVLIYSIALSMMFFSTALTLSESDWGAAASVLVAVGGMLFFSSDSLLSYNRFVRPVPCGQFLVRILYHLGQIALTSGVLIHFIV
jgi:alkenylglycerophosphocholine/alkenylglycerophosphoethanolamine hydrolase